MNSKPFFTVITVTYNSSQFVRDAIESVLASTFTDFELIIGDDCSTDNTWEIIKEYNDPRIVKYRNETNLREYPNRNKALNFARGEWVIFIDGDDIIYNQALFKLASYIENYGSRVNMVLMELNLNWALIPFVISGRLFFLTSSTRKSLNNVAFTKTVFRRKDIVKSFYKCLLFGNGDQIVRLVVANDSGVLIIEDQLTWWRETPGQASSVIGKDIKTWVNDIFFQFDNVKSKGLNEDEINIFIINKLIDVNRIMINQLKTLQIINFIKTCFYFRIELLKIFSLTFTEKEDFLPQYSASSPVKCGEWIE
jgi:glycosyltransferase involved in cell wall biosynthesis